ncbi:MAG: pyridoxal phosphate-dependent aminotransferase [Nitrospirales bacterium]|nr:pyridoxal phosphate-dependent aminotransferase [Nitrospirales bacterium]
MKLATRTTRIAPSPTLHLAATVKAMKARGLEVFDFGAGEPAQDTPDFVKDAAYQSMKAGFTKYTPVAGTEELKEAIVEKFQQDQGLQYEKSQVLVSCGAKHSLYNLAQALFEAGDEVIIPSPYWVSYPDQVVLSDATPIFVMALEEANYAIDPSALKASISPRTKAIILNSPCNPTGSIYDRKTLEAIAELALRHDLIIVSDEIYEKILYDNQPHVSIASLAPEVAKRTVVVNGVSKSYSMTGWRIGYAAGPKELIRAMGNIQGQSTSNPTSIAQKAALAALRGDQSFIRQMLEELYQQRNCIVEQLNSIQGLSCSMPAGAFYAFPNVSGLLGKRHAKGTLNCPTDLANYLLTEAKVACVPGEPFGSQSHIRLSYTPPLETIRQGMDQMAAAIKALS